jgi:hypothetical protein
MSTPLKLDEFLESYINTSSFKDEKFHLAIVVVHSVLQSEAHMVESGIRHQPLDLPSESSTAEKYHISGINHCLKIRQ